MDFILFCFLFDKKIYLSKVETEFKISILKILFLKTKPLLLQVELSIYLPNRFLYSTKNPQKNKNL